MNLYLDKRTSNIPQGTELVLLSASQPPDKDTLVSQEHDFSQTSVGSFGGVGPAVNGIGSAANGTIFS